MYSSPCRENGVGTVRPDMPWISHSRLPSRSYERTPCVPAVTISVRSSFSQTNGVAQFWPRSSRSTRQTSAPVSRSRATMNERITLSFTM